MAIPISTGAFVRSLEPGVKKWFGEEYDRYPRQFEELVDIQKSDKYAETTVSMHGMGLASVKNESGSIAFDDMAQGPSKQFIHKVYALGYRITKEHREDNMYMQVANAKSRALATSMKETKEIVVSNVLNRAFNSAYTGYDGVELISNAHVLTKGGTQSNELSTAADLSEVALETALIELNNLKCDAGLKMNARATKLIIPTAYAFDAHRILKSDLQNDTANNAINALKAKGMLPAGYVVNNYLTDSDAFFLKTNQAGMYLFQRRPLTMASDTPDFTTDNIAFKADERYSVDFDDYRCYFGSDGTGS